MAQNGVKMIHISYTCVPIHQDKCNHYGLHMYTNRFLFKKVLWNFISDCTNDGKEIFHTDLLSLNALKRTLSWWKEVWVLEPFGSLSLYTPSLSGLSSFHTCASQLQWFCGWRNISIRTASTEAAILCLVENSNEEEHKKVSDTGI